MTSTTASLHERFCALADKYAVSVPESWRLEKNDSGCSLRDATRKTGFIPLLPWRCERRFVELRRIVESKTLEDVVLCRFSCVADASETDLESILYREFDLLEWITAATIVSVFSSEADGRFANVLARLSDGAICSVEAGTTLPSGAEAPLLDRHELIARRGVASDRVVDTHVPQHSVYLFDRDGVKTYTDTDAELFGLDCDEINAVRAAFELAGRPELADRNTAQHEHLLELVDRARHSPRPE